MSQAIELRHVVREDVENILKWLQDPGGLR